MSATEFKRILEKSGLTVIDVSAATKIHPQTVTRFLKGGKVHASTLAALEAYVASKSLVSPTTAKGAIAG